MSRAHYLHLKGEYDRALKLYPPDDNYSIGTLLVSKGQLGLAAEHLEKAVKKQPDFAPAWGNLIAAYRQMHRYREGIEAAEKAFELCDRDHRMAALLVNLGTIHLELNEREKAEELLREAVQLDPKDPKAHWNLGLACLAQKKWADGWEGYDHGFRANERLPSRYFNEIPEWIGEDLRDKTIVVWGEQGLGDEILFAQCLPDLKKIAKKVIFDCHPRLENIFRKAFPGVTVTGTRKSKTTEWLDAYEPDYHCPLCSLPPFFRKEDSDFPDKGYLKAKPKKKDRIRVGLSWQGGSEKDNARRRSMTLDELAFPLMQIARRKNDIEFVSLQYGHVYDEVDRFSRYGLPLTHDEADLEDYDRTASLVASCDLVISVITSVVHLAGALDVETWCLTPVAPPWKFHEGEDLIWHPSVRQFHQSKRYEWSSVIGEVGNEFKQWLDRHPPH